MLLSPAHFSFTIPGAWYLLFIMKQVTREINLLCLETTCLNCSSTENAYLHHISIHRVWKIVVDSVVRSKLVMPVDRLLSSWEWPVQLPSLGSESACCLCWSEPAQQLLGGLHYSQQSGSSIRIQEYNLFRWLHSVGQGEQTDQIHPSCLV